ncbi:MAG: peptide deformylase [Candidatus Pacebacteria bacterium]|nr:peptide deformylase [Candidatus Paceibacterota bacterium]
MQILQGQCRKQSRKVLESDFERIKKLSGEMIDLCRTKLGRYPMAHAIAHCQVDHNDPLRFFVTYDGMVIINPKIVKRDSETITIIEACYSFANREGKNIKRYAKIYVDYQFMKKKGDVVQRRDQLFEDTKARVVQHELDHFQGKSIYS